MPQLRFDDVDFGMYFTMTSQVNKYLYYSCLGWQYDPQGVGGKDDVRDMMMFRASYTAWPAREAGAPSSPPPQAVSSI